MNNLTHETLRKIKKLPIARRQKIIDACADAWEAAERVVAECERIKTAAHYKADHYTYDIMRTVLAAAEKKL